MDRRTFVAGMTGGLLAALLAAEAQPVGKVWRIGYLSPLSPAADATRREGFQQGLERLGYREGQNIAIADFEQLHTEIDKLMVPLRDDVGNAPALGTFKRHGAN